MKQLIIAGPVAAIMLTAAGCTGSGAPGGAASYLAVRNSKVVFIQWRTASNGHLHGTITEDSAGGSAPAQTLSVSSTQFTGTMTGNTVTLTFPVLFFLHTRAHGTLSGSALTMWVPWSDGTVQQAKFSQSGEAGYDGAIATLHGRIRHANLLAAKQQTRQPVHAQAEHITQIALSTLYRASSLAFGGMLAGGLTRFADDIQAARAHLAKEKIDASGSNKYCAAAFKVAGDAKAVDGALQSVQGDILSMLPDISAVRHDVAIANAHVRHLSKAGVPVLSSASNVIANASANLKQAIAKANLYIDLINAIDAQARAITNKLATRSCSGALSGNPFRPIPHIR